MPRQLAIPLDWFVDPVTKEILTVKLDGLYSSIARYTKNESRGFWNFMPQNLEELNNPLWQTWCQLQKNGIISYRNDPYNNLGVGLRKDYLEFGKFCNLNGNILDVGVGPQTCPIHILHCKKKDMFFIGIDPLVGEQPRDFAFVQSLGEYLPFRAKLFDRVLFVTSLDHFINLYTPLIEAQRVLKDGGYIYIWIGEKNKNTPNMKESPDWYKKLELPTGADDFFHFKRLSAQKAESCFTELGLKIKDKEVHAIDSWRKNYFYRLVI